MGKTTLEKLFLPEPGLRRIVCGVLVSEWNYAVVYVRNQNNDLKTTQKFYFTFFGSGSYYLDEVVTYVEQWTYVRGDTATHYHVGSHEYNRARKMACQTVGTYRRRYLVKHGNGPNPLRLERTLDECLTNPRVMKKMFPKSAPNYLAQLPLLIAGKPL